ncbi:MAG: hypothetical protein NT118_09505 [Lentisphaerae bacterium]|nr:hypothetical protein [Lentisphaerota bacterium]
MLFSALSRAKTVYDPNYGRNDNIDRKFFESAACKILRNEDEIYSLGLDIIVVVSPDHFHSINQKRNYFHEEHFF